MRLLPVRGSGSTPMAPMSCQISNSFRNEFRNTIDTSQRKLLTGSGDERGIMPRVCSKDPAVRESSYGHPRMAETIVAESRHAPMFPQRSASSRPRERPSRRPSQRRTLAGRRPGMLRSCRLPASRPERESGVLKEEGGGAQSGCDPSAARCGIERATDQRFTAVAAQHSGPDRGTGSNCPGPG
jgi:hypothetical protein